MADSALDDGDESGAQGGPCAGGDEAEGRTVDVSRDNLQMTLFTGRVCSRGD